jgi:hypothetical protein
MAISEQSRRPEHEADDDQQRRRDDPDIAAVRDMGTKRVVTHATTVPGGLQCSRLGPLVANAVVSLREPSREPSRERGRDHRDLRRYVRRDRSGAGSIPARARRTASRSGSRTRRSHALCHSQAAPQVEHESRAEPPE